MSRTRRFIGGLVLGYAGQAMVMGIALWLTPFLLHRIGQHDYGLWLVATQLLSYLLLLDIGVVALLPRETAYATGRVAAGVDNREVPQLIGETARLVLLQMPLVTLAALLVWFAMPEAWSSLRPPMAIVLLVFVLLFPLRIFQGVLEGMQDLAFLGQVHIASALTSVGATVFFVLRGSGLYSLAFGWIFGQLVMNGLWSWRIVRHYSAMIPARLPRLGWERVKFHLVRGGWMSIVQIAQVLMTATDLVIVGAIFGPAAVVPFAITAKLVEVFANQPHLLMRVAAPGLSEMRTSEETDRLFEVSSALSLAMLNVSGLLAVVILAVNEGFVGWWVGASQFSGLPLTVVLIASMILRHWNVSVAYTLFCFGFEKHLAIAALKVGVVTVVTAAGLAWFLGPIGAPLGSIIGVLSMGLRLNVPEAARETGVSVGRFLWQMFPWAWRFTLLASGSIALATFWRPDTFIQLALTAAGTAVLYLIVMSPVLLNPPLGPYLKPRISAIRSRVWTRAA